MGPVAPATFWLANAFHSCPFPFLLHLGTYSAPWARPVISGVPGVFFSIALVNVRLMSRHSGRNVLSPAQSFIWLDILIHSGPGTRS